MTNNLCFNYAFRGTLTMLVQQIYLERTYGDTSYYHDIATTKTYLCLELARCVSSLHDICSVAHLDLKLDNIVITNRLKMALIDFGSAENLRFTRDTYAHCQGSFEYRSPEQEFEGANKSFDGFKADIFSLGVMMFIIFTGRYPIMAGRNASPDDFRELYLSPDTRLTDIL